MLCSHEVPVAVGNVDAIDRKTPGAKFIRIPGGRRKRASLPVRCLPRIIAQVLHPDSVRFKGAYPVQHRPEPADQIGRAHV